MSVENKFLKARAKLLMDQPFFGTLALRLKVIETDDIEILQLLTVAVLCTTPSLLINFYPPTRWLNCSRSSALRVQSYDAPSRTRPKYLERCVRLRYQRSLACMWFHSYLKAGIVDTEGEFKDMTAEAIYNKLFEDGHVTEMPVWGLVQDAGQQTIDGSSNAGMESDWQVAVSQAAELAKAQGKLPGHLETAIGDVLEPVVDWRQVLWPFFTNTSRDEYTWRKPNRAYISEDEYLPSMFNESAGAIAICVDTSGSISDAELHQFWSEIVAVAKETRPERIICLGIDTQVNDEFEWADINDMLEEPPTFSGRGGTRFAPAFEHLNDSMHDIEACVYLTDLECDDFGDEPHYPVLWVSTSKNLQAPWGETIYMETQ